MPTSLLRKPLYESGGRDVPCSSRASIKLEARQVEKPWGRGDIPRMFASTGGRRIGEIWFEHPLGEELPLLVKYIFTSENLSIQVHPDDEQALQRGLRRGKTECWYILDAEPGATIGLGLREPISPAGLRAAALDGSIERRLDWRPVAAGDFFYVPAGTIHALGAGIAVLELQQNSDATYRLYDYGRPRELHLEDGVAVSRAGTDAGRWARRASGPIDAVLHSSSHFCLVRASSSGAIPASLSDRRRWVIPLDGSVDSESGTASAGECLLIEPGARLSLSESAVILIGAEGPV